MKNDSYTVKTFILDLINFCLNTIKNSQLINLVIASMIHTIIFVIISLGFLFNFYEERVSLFIVNFGQYFIQNNYNIDGSRIIQYYFLLILILGILQEFALLLVCKIFKKDLHKTIHKSKKVLFFSVSIAMLVIEIIMSIAIKEYWLSLVGITSFGILVLFHSLHRFTSHYINKIQNYVGMLYNIHI